MRGLEYKRQKSLSSLALAHAAQAMLLCEIEFFRVNIGKTFAEFFSLPMYSPTQPLRLISGKRFLKMKLLNFQSAKLAIVFSISCALFFSTLLAPPAHAQSKLPPPTSH